MSFSNFLIILFRIFRESDYNFGDVVLVGFPFTNLQTTKKRPAVVISRKRVGLGGARNEPQPTIVDAIRRHSI
uniref:PemK-like, MazF-like toxin of type II toxin-antitoxin system n=1 Tax=Candidatus Kentrum sp. UNK TaxID=2126344 RepID=A0A451ASL8_9GAMM|nr:MAG: hypothetical protein BECKUNK1418G_GA0071005_100641 [Candidatus Kentron sp. UNK]VFK69038.1 MAG: hypothetical protein BECKUNK1418H_GA0071006_100933 [Candidatus Kentron sp. UNK]